MNFKKKPCTGTGQALLMNVLPLPKKYHFKFVNISISITNTANIVNIKQGREFSLFLLLQRTDIGSSAIVTKAS